MVRNESVTRSGKDSEVKAAATTSADDKSKLEDGFHDTGGGTRRERNGSNDGERKMRKERERVNGREREEIRE